ncbi:PBSX family phage terminase large subunit [Lactobacillus crispatus]|uniref:PBSX family phage terminase large subunit n=1 Tax=Lactobacillus crispatus TaxID=47770 RepID=UPI0018AC03D3|nr:PBSX family phage terminase large subunit [Lactobacillus crispatus]
MHLKQVLNKHFTEKQQMVLKQFFNNPHWSLMINYGAVRSGKTIANNYCFILSLISIRKQADKDGVKDPLYILAGTSKKNIYNNVLNPLFNDFDLVPEQDSVGNLHLFGVTIILAYTGTIAGLRGIRGSSAYGAYINEASLANESVFNEIRDRCSEGDGRVICDTNPDIPTHWLKVDYIDNKSDNIISNHFVLDDNTFLSKRYIENKKATTPSGMLYDRSVLGLWVTGEGVVYEDFDKNTMLVDSVPDNLNYYCGVDWGFAKGHENVITVLGDDPETDTSYLVDIFSSTGKFIDYWVDIAHKIQDAHGLNINFWADSARPEYVSYFQQNNINARNADKSVMDGVEYCAQRIKMGKFKVLRKCAKPFLDDIYQYVWDPVKGVPKKEHDNVMDSFRYGLFNQHKKYDNQVLPNIYL